MPQLENMIKNAIESPEKENIVEISEKLSLLGKNLEIASTEYTKLLQKIEKFANNVNLFLTLNISNNEEQDNSATSVLKQNLDYQKVALKNAVKEDNLKKAASIIELIEAFEKTLNTEKAYIIKEINSGLHSFSDIEKILSQAEADAKGLTSKYRYLSNYKEEEPYNIKFPKCDKGHILVFSMYNEGAYSGGWYSCNKCRKNAKNKDGRYFCFQCQYDLCHSCSAEYEKMTATKCKKGHNLVWSNYNEGGYSCNLYCCDLCNVNKKCSDGRFYCNQCHFDACISCASKT